MIIVLKLCLFFNIFTFRCWSELVVLRSSNNGFSFNFITCLRLLLQLRYCDGFLWSEKADLIDDTKDRIF